MGRHSRSDPGEQEVLTPPPTPAPPRPVPQNAHPNGGHRNGRLNGFPQLNGLTGGNAGNGHPAANGHPGSNGHAAPNGHAGRNGYDAPSDRPGPNGHNGYDAPNGYDGRNGSNGHPDGSATSYIHSALADPHPVTRSIPFPIDFPDARPEPRRRQVDQDTETTLTPPPFRALPPPEPAPGYEPDYPTDYTPAYQPDYQADFEPDYPPVRAEPDDRPDLDERQDLDGPHDEDEDDEAPLLLQWSAFVLQTELAAAAGVGIWLGFYKLWSRWPFYASAAVGVAIVGMLVVARFLRRRYGHELDLLTTLLTVAVGVVLTVLPAAFSLQNPPLGP